METMSLLPRPLIAQPPSWEEAYPRSDWFGDIYRIHIEDELDPAPTPANLASALAYRVDPRTGIASLSKED